MLQILRNIIKTTFPRQASLYKAYKALIDDETSYLFLTGWMVSLTKNAPTDINGENLPWMNYPIIAFVKERLNQNHNLFEFGSGYSTTFYAKRVKAVTSVEYDIKWYEHVKDSIPNNVTLLYKSYDIDGEYCRSIISTNHKYDIVIIDGRDRVNCLKQSINALTDNGVILLDDSQRERYKEGISFAQAQGFRTLSYEGLKPTGTGIDKTTILYRPNNCLGI